MEPAAIRYNNPGAMWGSALARKWGAGPAVVLHDGLGQGNNIAVFPDKVHGAAAQFDLWRTSKNYANKPLAEALRIWSGGNWWQSYVKFLTDRVPGLTGDTVISEQFLRSPMALAMMKAQAWHESGKPYPMTNLEWHQAQELVFKGSTALPPTDPLIRIGDTGTDVTKMQKLLGCIPTGTYDERSETEFALRLFQVRNHLDPDGQCGSLTWDKLKQKGVIA